MKATLPHLRASKGSYLIVSTTLHYRGMFVQFRNWRARSSSIFQGSIYQAHVSAAKAAVDAFSVVLALEEAPHGVRSNVIAPGATGATEGMDRLWALTERTGKVSKTLPGGRVAHFEDINNATIFLLSGAASYITGQILVVDGGWESLRLPFMPYPDSVLDPASFQDAIKAKL